MALVTTTQFAPKVRTEVNRTTYKDVQIQIRDENDLDLHVNLIVKQGEAQNLLDQLRKVVEENA